MKVINGEEFLSPKEACAKLGLHYQTLRKYDSEGKIITIRSEGGKRFYNVKKYIEDNKDSIKDIIKRNICYCRVSSNKQKDDLLRQINYMKERYPDYEIISDIGSGLNFNRSGLNKLINYPLNREIGEVVVSYKDRLARFGIELIERIINYSDGKLIILNSYDNSPQEELTKDLVLIMNVFSAKLNGSRRYTNK